MDSLVKLLLTMVVHLPVRNFVPLCHRMELSTLLAHRITHLAMVLLNVWSRRLNKVSSIPGSNSSGETVKILILFTYRITPQTTTGVAPAMLLMRRCLRSCLDRLFPDILEKVQDKQSKQAQHHVSSKPLQTFKVKDRVYAKDFSTTPITWVLGIIVGVTGPLSYLIELLSGRVVRRHIDAIQNRDVGYPRPSVTDCTEDDYLFPDLPRANIATPIAPVRRSTQQRHPPDRLGL